MSFTRWLSAHLGLSSRTPGLAPQPVSKRKASAPRQTCRPRLECLEDRWVPSTLHVTSGDDSLTQHGTLRWAVANAQSGDTILVSNDVEQTGITLTQGELLLGRDVTIATKGVTPVTISGGGISRIFEVAGGAHVTLTNLTITGGNGLADNPAGTASQDGLGGGIVVDAGATLTIRGSTLSGNSAAQGGGINNDGTLTVRDSTLSGNSAGGGAGIANFGTLTVRDSTLSGNSAYDGGGIFNGGALTVSGSTLSGNSATHSGGGITNDQGTLSVRDSTLSSNSAQFGGGIYNNNATATVSGSTVSGNSANGTYGRGGGIYNNGTLTVSSSSTITRNIAAVGFGVDVYNSSVLYLDSSSIIGILDGNPAVPI